MVEAEEVASCVEVVVGGSSYALMAGSRRAYIDL
jgi:hypothetical protein